MRFGVKFPTKELGSDPGLIREWARTAQGVGFDHVVLIEHVMGVDPDARPDYGAAFPGNSKRPPYTFRDSFDEPLVTMGFLAGACDLELATGVLILPQRQTALVAKQTTQVDRLTAGRLRLCVGVGWNPVEYEALGMDFRTRGRRIEEQIALLRALWSSETVDFRGEFDTVVGCGVSPRPVQQPIPLWIAGAGDRVLDRIGRLGDGWFYGVEPEPDFEMRLERVHAAAAAAGRDPGALGLEGSIELRHGLDVEARLSRWQALGATHLQIDPMNSGVDAGDHPAFLERIADSLGLRARGR